MANKNNKFNNRYNNKYGKISDKQRERMEKYPWVPFVIIIIMALLLIALNSFMVDFLGYVNSQEPSETGESVLFIFREIFKNKY